MLLSYIVWNADPEMFSIGDLSIRWYGFFLAISFLISYVLLGYVMRKQGFKQIIVDKLSIYVIIGTVVGLRLGHVLFYDPVYYFQNPLEIFNIRGGGLASHGGAAGILLAVWLFSRKQKISYLGLLDRIVMVVPFVGGMVRLGNLMNSEIIGMPTTVPWAFIFERLDGQMLRIGDQIINLGATPLHPTQLYEAIFYLLMFVVFFFIYKKYNTKWKDGTFLGWFLIVLFTFRFLIEYTKIDQVEFEGWTEAIRMGQLLSIPFILLGLFFIGRGYGWFKKRVKTTK